MKRGPTDVSPMAFLTEQLAAGNVKPPPNKNVLTFCCGHMIGESRNDLTPPSGVDFSKLLPASLPPLGRLESPILKKTCFYKYCKQLEPLQKKLAQSRGWITLSAQTTFETLRFSRHARWGFLQNKTPLEPLLGEYSFFFITPAAALDLTSQ